MPSEHYSSQTPDTLKKYVYFLFANNKTENSSAQAAALYGGAFFVTVNSRLFLVTAGQNITELNGTKYMYPDYIPDTLYLASSGNNQFSLAVDITFIKKIVRHNYYRIKTPFIFYETSYPTANVINPINALLADSTAKVNSTDTILFYGHGPSGANKILLLPVEQSSLFKERKTKEYIALQNNDSNMVVAICNPPGKSTVIKAGCPVFVIRHDSSAESKDTQVHFGGMVSAYDSVTGHVYIVKPSLFLNEVIRLQRAFINR